MFVKNSCVGDIYALKPDTLISANYINLAPPRILEPTNVFFCIRARFNLLARDVYLFVHTWVGECELFVCTLAVFTSLHST